MAQKQNDQHIELAITLMNIGISQKQQVHWHDTFYGVIQRVSKRISTTSTVCSSEKFSNSIPIMLTNKQEWNKRHGFKLDEDHSKSEIGRISKIPPYIIDEVLDRGYGAHRTNPSSVRLKGSFVKKADAPLSARLTPTQWAYARLYSFVNKLEGRRLLNHDFDLAKKISL